MMRFTQSLSFVFLVALLTQGPFVAETRAGEATRLAEPLEVVIETSRGSLTIELYRDKAPRTVANFLAYVDDGFYTNTLFHRVVPGFVVQGGGYEAGLRAKETRAPIDNESDNLLRNLVGTVAMARKTHPDTATSQFFINLSHNTRLDHKSEVQPGYTVFGRVSEGMDVVGAIAAVPTTTVNRFRGVPEEDVRILSIERKRPSPVGHSAHDAEGVAHDAGAFVAGQDYVVLPTPVATRNRTKIEVVELFSYGCPHCYELEGPVREWSRRLGRDVDFWVSPAIWNEPMALYARAYYAARELDVDKIVHHPLFAAIVIEQRTISTERELTEFFAAYGVDREEFVEAFRSSAVDANVQGAEERVRLYRPVGVPEIIVAGKYRVDRMRAGGLKEMLAVADYLIERERADRRALTQN